MHKREALALAEEVGKNGCNEEAVLVAAHAKWQQSRGRGPSLPYNGEKNPRKALALAKEQLGDYVARPGEHIQRVASINLKLAFVAVQEIQFKFNGVELVARPGRHPVELLRFFDSECERRSQEWLNSPKGQEYLRRRAAAIRRKQRKCDQLLADLPGVDASDYWQVLLWIKQYIAVSDDVSVNRSADVVIEALLEKGFLPNVNCQDDFKRDDKENVARYIIGQVLACLQEVGCIHPGLSDFIVEWRRKFHSTPGRVGRVKDNDFQTFEVADLIALVANLNVSNRGLAGLADTMNAILGQQLFDEAVLTPAAIECDKLDFKRLGPDLHRQALKCKQVIFRELPNLYRLIRVLNRGVQHTLTPDFESAGRKDILEHFIDIVSRNYGPTPIVMDVSPVL